MGPRISLLYLSNLTRQKKRRWTAQKSATRFPLTHPKNRHLDRSDGQSHRPPRVEKPALSEVEWDPRISLLYLLLPLLSPLRLLLPSPLPLELALALSVAFAVVFAFAFAFEIERGFSPASSQPQSGPTALPKGRSAARRAKRSDHRLCFCGRPCFHRLSQNNPPTTNNLQLFSSKTPQKSLVKSQNRLTQTKSATSKWHFSYIQPAILNILIENEAAPANRRG